MERQPVQSSNIAAIGYDPTQSALEIEFKGSGVYLYSGVPADAHQQLMSSASLGRHFAQHIKGQFDYRRVHGAKP